MKFRTARACLRKAYFVSGTPETGKPGDKIRQKFSAA